MSLDSAIEIEHNAQYLEFGIAFGSNLGDRLANLSAAKQQLLSLCCCPDKAIFSPVFESIPVDCAPETRSFFNAVGELPFDSLPEHLLSKCLRIEKNLGRPNVHKNNSPRTIDLDLLYAGNKIHSDANLTIPHPRLKIRLFVVAPLALIRPDLRLPGEQLTINDHLKKLSAKQSPLRMVTQHW